MPSLLTSPPRIKCHVVEANGWDDLTHERQCDVPLQGSVVYAVILQGGDLKIGSPMSHVLTVRAGSVVVRASGIPQDVDAMK